MAKDKYVVVYVNDYNYHVCLLDKTDKKFYRSVCVCKTLLRANKIKQALNKGEE